MSATYYECRVTFMAPRICTGAEPIERIPGWTFSQIDGDPVLGKGVKSYLTRQMKSSIPLGEVVRAVDKAGRDLQKLGYEVLRRKVELVVYDTRQTTLEVD